MHKAKTIPSLFFVAIQTDISDIDQIWNTDSNIDPPYAFDLDIHL